MKKFEYLIKKVTGGVSNKFLNEFGEKGWELISVKYEPTLTTFIFKKEIVKL